MARDLIGVCPICDGKLKVTQIACKKCGTKITGDFELNKFCQLKKEQLFFAEIFIKNRGNIKEIEKELGVSYPTVRRLLDEVIEALGYHTDVKKSDVDKSQILDRLSKGEITADEALKLINGENN